MKTEKVDKEKKFEISNTQKNEDVCFLSLVKSSYGLAVHCDTHEKYLVIFGSKSVIISGSSCINNKEKVIVDYSLD